MEARKRLRELVDAKEILVLPGAYDALSARLAEAAGFPCVYMTGYGQSASKLGAPDVGLMTMSEMVERAKDMCAAVSVPVICDGDTGFGNVVNLVRTVREYERAGAAAIQLEDQTTPKKCGHMLGRQVVDAEEMVNKIRAAAAARQDPDFLIIARTDARTNHGVEEAIRRELSRKLDAMICHERFTQYKTAATEAEREQARQRYLESIGMPADFRW